MEVEEEEEEELVEEKEEKVEEEEEEEKDITLKVSPPSSLGILFSFLSVLVVFFLVQIHRHQHLARQSCHS